MPRALYALSFGNFAVGAGAFMVAAIVAPVAAGLSVSLSQASQLLAAYAIAYAVASPILITAIRAGEQRVWLASAMAVFACGALVCAWAPNFLAVELGRVIMALGAAVFTPMAAATGAQLAPPEKRGAALATVFIGLSLAQVFAVPAAGPLAEAAGWRMTFVAVAMLAVLTAAVAYWVVPPSARASPIKASALLDVARKPAILLGFGVIAFHMAANFVVFTYMGPVLAQMSGLDKGGVAILFWVFGVAAVIGAWAGGQLADKITPTGALAVSTLGLAASMAAFALSAGSVVMVAVTVAAWAMFGFGVNAPQQARVFGLAGAAAAPALALNASALYVGTALGGAVAGAALASVGLKGLAWIGVGMALAALLCLGLSHHLATRAVVRVSEKAA